MTDHTQLRKLASDLIATEKEPFPHKEFIRAFTTFQKVATPQAVIELLDEIDKLKQVFRVNMLRAFPGKSHDEITAEIEKALK